MVSLICYFRRIHEPEVMETYGNDENEVEGDDYEDHEESEREYRRGRMLGLGVGESSEEEEEEELSDEEIERRRLMLREKVLTKKEEASDY